MNNPREGKAIPRPIDHVVLAVADLAAAAALYRALGFIVGARNRHPWGTENAIVQLDGSFLELIALGEGFALPAPDEPAFPFARAVAAAVARGGGLALMAMSSADADADAAVFSAAGLGQGRRLDFGRSAEGADGARRPVRFSLAFADDPALPEAGFFTCCHHHPETFWNPAAQRHANGALRLDGVVLAAAQPARHVGLLATVCGVAPVASDAGPSVATPTGRIDVMTPEASGPRFGPGAVAGRFAAFTIRVTSLDAARRILDDAGVPHAEIAGALVIPPGTAFGVALAFAAAPCHSPAASGG